MNIYTDYVFPDKLISPVTGYVCRTITPQNISRFGFSSIVSLHESYPGFPLCCDDLRSQRKRNYRNPNLIKSNILKEKYSANPAHCQECKATFSYRKRNNKFCDNSCAAKYNNRIMTAVSRAKQKQSLRITISKKPKVAKRKNYQQKGHA